MFFQILKVSCILGISCLIASAAGAQGGGAGTSGLVASYHFDEGSGTVLHDSSGNGNDGVVSGATWMPGKSLSALSFNGRDSWVTVPGSPSLDLATGMTLEAWVNPNQLSGSWRTVVLKEQSGHLAYALYANGAGPGPSSHVNTGADRYATRSAVLPTGRWSFLTGTYDGANVRLYVNGQLSATFAATGTIARSTQPLRIGGNSVWSEWFSGLIDEVKVYNRPLTAAEITTDMNVTNQPADTQAPSTPAGLAQAASTATSINVRWTAATDNVGVAGYTLYKNNVAVSTNTGASFNYTGLTCGTSYTLAVDAYDAAGNHSPRASLTAATAACSDAQPPSQPANLAKTAATATSISVSWSASTDNVGVSGYTLSKNGVAAGTATNTNASFSGLSCGTSYSLAVDAYDAAGNHSAKTSLTASTSACPSVGASVFMSSSGSDANPCTQARPCKSFDRAYHVATPGATVEVAAGSYGGETINPDSSKASGPDVVFRPATGASVTVTGQIDVHAAHLELRDMTVTELNFPREADHVTIRNVVNHGTWMQGPSNISIIGGEISCGGSCNFHSHIENGGADSHPPTNILFDHVYFHDWQSVAGEHTECLQILGGDTVSIRNSTFKNCGTANGGLGSTADLHLQSYGSPAPKNILIENNFFYRAGNLYTIQGEDFQNLDIRYNSFAGPILLYDGPGPGTGIDIIGNILPYDAWAGCTAQNNGVPINWRYNVMQGGTCGPTDKNAAPGYVDSNNDLHLVASSAAINAGDPATYPPTDIDGLARPRGAGPDAGASEAVTGDAQPPSTPTNLAQTAATTTKHQPQLDRQHRQRRCHRLRPLPQRQPRLQRRRHQLQLQRPDLRYELHPRHRRLRRRRQPLQPKSIDRSHEHLPRR